MTYPAVQTPAIAVGTRLTDYATVDLTVEGLASGGMGLVVWGQNATQGHPTLALKLLKPERLAAASARSPEQRHAVERQFEDEALVWCHLWYHPCVVTAYSLTRLPGLGHLPVLVLAYAPHGSLRDYLRRSREQQGHPALRSALAWAIHIASALAHIHQPDADHDRPAPLVHCDLKPENVLLDAKGWAQLTDLGLTRAYAALAADADDPAALAPASDVSVPTSGLSAHQAEVAGMRAILRAAGALAPDQSAAGSGDAHANLFATRTLRIPAVAPPQTSPGPGFASPAAIGSRGPVAGSPPYMAPEQWLGLDAAVPATDLYAFGVLLFELFAGTECPHLFPFDPTPYVTPALTSHALATGYDATLLAWHAAHTAPGGPAHRLSDPDVADAALRSGPFAELVTESDGDTRAIAMAALRQLDVLIEACLAPNPDSRPSAADVRDRLAAFATGPCGLDPLPMPEPAPATAQSEGAFWSNLGTTYTNLLRDEEAIAAKRRGIEHNPTHPMIWNNLGVALDSLGEQERRRGQDAASAGRKTEAAALAARARQHWEEALDAYQQAEARVTSEFLTGDPTFPAFLANNQGSVLNNLGRYAEAAGAYQRALAFQPGAHDTRFNLAKNYAEWSREQTATPTERLDRLQAAQREIADVLDAAPGYSKARLLADLIARDLADAARYIQG